MAPEEPIPDRQTAVVTDGTGEVWTEMQPVRAPAASEALVRVDAVGICGTDLELIDGHGPPWTEYPVVLGHEVAGKVVAVGDEVTKPTVGDHVALHGFLHCGRCDPCLAGRYYQCEELREVGISVDGGYRPYGTWPAETLHRIPDSLSAATATQIDTAGCMLHALDRADLGVGQTGAVLGGGPMGLFAVQLLQAHGVSPVAVTDPVPERLAAAEALGAATTINVDSADPEAELHAMTNGAGVDVCVEAAGAGDVLDTAVQATAAQGQIVLTGVFDEPKPLDPTTVVVKELTIRGGVTAAHAADRTADLFAGGQLTADGIITHEFPLAEYEHALETVRERRDGVIKAVLRPNPNSVR